MQGFNYKVEYSLLVNGPWPIANMTNRGGDNGHLGGVVVSVTKVADLIPAQAKYLFA